ncbi:hypothetical protein DM860_015930 [Cuscuta australis]|uniref:Uncharacterized protein n=1 Tax=Cuscuta australis TaxID=267555 RepID=A0A328E2W3_9ASTE|nr:hypothetical protein DM860_015930 [Cuscuta australis]
MHDRNRCFKWFASSPNPKDLEEVKMLLASPVFEFCYRDEVETFPYIGNFVSNWDRLSKVWALYSATGNHYFDKDGESELMRSCRIGGIDSLRNSLGLLKKVKLEELGLRLQAQVGKSGYGGSTFKGCSVKSTKGGIGGSCEKSEGCALADVKLSKCQDFKI